MPPRGGVRVGQDVRILGWEHYRVLLCQGTASEGKWAVDKGSESHHLFAFASVCGEIAPLGAGSWSLHTEV